MNTKDLQNSPPRRTFKEKIMAHTLNMPAKSSLYFTATNLISKGASFIFTPIFTRLLTPAEYGEYSLFSSYLSVAIVIVTLEIPGNVIMRAFQKKRGFEMLSVITASAIPLILTPLCIAVLYFMRGGPSFSFAYLFLGISLASISFINLYISACKFLYRWRAPLFIAIAQSIVTPVLSITLINVGAFAKFEHVTVKIGVAAAITALIALTLFALALKGGISEWRQAGMRAKSYPAFVGALFRTLFRLCIPLLPYYFSVMLISQADKLIISRELGREALGKYSIAYSAGIALSAVTGGIMSALCPWIMRKVRAGDISALRRAIGAIINIAVPAVMLFLCAAPEVFGILAPESYKSALPVLFIIAIIPLPLAISGCLCSIAVAKEKTSGILLSGIGAAVFATVADILFIERAQLFVPAIITALSYTALMFSEALYVGKILGEKAINVNKTFQKVVFLAFAAAIIFTLKESVLSRAVIAVFSALSLLYMLKRSGRLLSERPTD